MTYPVGEPFEHGHLEVSDGHTLHWERVGNPRGKPAVVLHGGPGSGATPWWRTFQTPDFRLGFARLVTHFFGNNGFLEPDAITGRLDRIADIPTVFVRGRLDIASPLGNAWRLAKALTRCELHVVEEEGHGGEPPTNAILVEATDRFARQPDNEWP